MVRKHPVATVVSSQVLLAYAALSVYLCRSCMTTPLNQLLPLSS